MTLLRRGASDDFDRVQAWALANVCAVARILVPGWGTGRGGHLRGPCFLHGGEHPNLDARDGAGWRCHSGCDTGGDGVDLWRRMRHGGLDVRAGRVAALKDLAPYARVVLDGHARPAPHVPAPRARPTVPHAPRALAVALAELRAGGMIPADPAAVFAGLVAIGRVVTDAADWAGRCLDSFHPAELAAAGLWDDFPAGGLRPVPVALPAVLVVRDGTLTFTPLGS